MSQGDYDDDADADSNGAQFGAKILVIEDLPWQTFVEGKFGANSGQISRERGRVCATHIQRMLRGYLVRSHVACHTSHVTRHTSHITRHTSHVTHHTSHITHHTSHITGAKTSGRGCCAKALVGKRKAAKGCSCGGGAGGGGGVFYYYYHHVTFNSFDDFVSFHDFVSFDDPVSFAAGMEGSSSARTQAI